MTTALPTAGPSANRNHNIDAFRVVANWVIICVHCHPFLMTGFGPGVELFGELLNQFVRIATPFFFLAAGYFFSVSLSRGSQPIPLALKLIKRLALFAVFWSLVYVFVPTEALLGATHVGYWAAVHAALQHARWLGASLLFNGTAVHLWFLPALACALALLAISVHLGVTRYVALLAAALFVAGLLGGAYQATPIGLQLNINTRNGPFFSSIFVFTGYLLHHHRARSTLRGALVLILIGIVLRALELLWITGRYGTPPSDIDYLIGTYPFGVGIFLWLLNSNVLGKSSSLVKLSRYSAGVYCAHMLLVDLVTTRPLVLGNPLWEILRPFVILALTFAFVMTLARLRVLRPVMT